MIQSDTGRTLLIKSDPYTDSIPIAEWRYWVLKRRGNDYIVIKAIPE